MGTYFETHKEVCFDKTFDGVMMKAYMFLAMNIVITGSVAFLMSRSENLMFSFLDTYFWFVAVLLAIIIIGFTYGKVILKMNYKAAMVLMIAFSMLVGILLSTVFLVFTIDSIFSCFIVTAVLFVTMSLLGHCANINLAPIMKICSIGVIGIILAGFVNIAIMKDINSFIISIAITLLFLVTVAVDTQNKKTRLRALEKRDEINKLSLYGALKLYIDFLIIYIRVFGYLKKMNPHK